MNRTALVTGANGGIGRAVAAALLAEGHDVMVAARDQRDAERVAGELGARPIALDVTAAIPDVSVDILVNCAGVLAPNDAGPLDVDLSVVEETLAVNTIGAWRLAQTVLPGMIARGWGRVVMVSSGTGAFSHGLHPGASGYSLSKAGLNAVTVLLASATTGTGVLVNAVNPGRVRTRMMPAATVSPEEAAADIVWAATLPADGPNGTFLRHRAVATW